MRAVKIISIFISALMFSLITSNVLAASRIEFTNDGAIKDRTLTSGPIKVIVNYKPIDIGNANADDTNLTYKIFHDNKPYINGKDSTYYTGYVDIKDIDKSGTPEVVISTFSGGAHCCTNTIIYSWNKDKFIKTETGMLDGTGGDFVDLNKDGKYEFTTYDNRFLYAFSSYAGSFPPTKIYAFNNGELEDVTRKYPKILRQNLQEMYKAYLNARKDREGEINGILAGYVAQKALLGEYEDGWKFLLANYDRKSDWGLEIYEKDRLVGKYPDFPTALKATLIEGGYLDAKGNPIR